MKRAAIYARHSTDGQDESCDRQVACARQFAEKLDVVVVESLVITDRSVSRAEFKKRPGIPKLLTGVEAGIVDVVICQDETRLGGDQIRTALLIEEVTNAGVELYYYATGERVQTDTATQRFVITLRNYVSELEREKTAQRTHEHLKHKATAGCRVGGAVYGYNSVRNADGIADWCVNTTEAAVIVTIHELRAEGFGYAYIAGELNQRGIPGPRRGKRGSGEWHHTTVRNILLRPMYRGTVVWNKTQKLYAGGTRVVKARAASEWVEVQRQDLRIVSDDIAALVDARFETTRRFTGKPKLQGPSPKYLLTGLANCSACGGKIMVSNGRRGKRPIKVYGCRRHRKQKTCDNTLRRPVDVVDQALVRELQRLLPPAELATDVAREMNRRYESQSDLVAGAGKKIRSEIRQLRAEVRRLAALAAVADCELRVVADEIKQRETRIHSLQSKLRAIEAPRRSMPLERIEALVSGRLTDLHALLDRNPAEARLALEAILAGPLTFARVGKGKRGRRYRVTGTVALDTMFTTVGVPCGI